MDLQQETVDLPLKSVWFVSVDDQGFVRDRIPTASRRSLEYLAALPAGAQTVRIGSFWPKKMLTREEFATWYQINGQYIYNPIGIASEDLAPAELERLNAPLVGSQFIGKDRQSIIHTPAFADTARKAGILHMVKTGGFANECLGDSAVDTVTQSGIDVTVLQDATADHEGMTVDGFQDRMLLNGVGLANTTGVSFIGQGEQARVRISRVIMPGLAQRRAG